MNKQKRAEMFIAIKGKMEEIQEIVRDYDALDEFLASYCFGLSTDTPLSQHFNEKTSYEFLAGFNAENMDEVDAMFDAMQRVYEESEDSNDGPSNQIDFWLNQN